VTTRASRKRLPPLTRDEIRALPAMVPLLTAMRAWDLSQTKAYAAVRGGTFPVPVERHGGRLMCAQSDIMAALRIPELPDAPLLQAS
jgi:hypothetical protein